jgi:hypothetical protein
VRLRTGILQQLRTAFAEIIFKPYAIVGLIELPEKLKTMKGPFGIPKPIQVRAIDGKKPLLLSAHVLIGPFR